MNIDGIKAYQIYCKYWISRKFIDNFGFSFLSNNFLIINKIIRFKDWGDLKRIAWILNGRIIDKDKEYLENLTTSFNNMLNNLDSDKKETVLYHFKLAADGLKLRAEHFNFCAFFLKEFSNFIGIKLIDNIYNINKNIGNYKENFFEERLQGGQSPMDYSSFVRVLKEELQECEIDNFDYEYDYFTDECSC